MVNVINISKPSQRGDRETYATRGMTEMLWYRINNAPDCAKRFAVPITCENMVLKVVSALEFDIRQCSCNYYCTPTT